MYSIEQFRKFNKSESMVLTQHSRTWDQQAAALMQRLNGCQYAMEYQTLTAEKRDEGLREMLRHGISIRQASRITGISFGIVRKFVGSS